MARLKTRLLQEERLGLINPKYRSFFRLETRRSTTLNKPVAIIEPHTFSSFMHALSNDLEIPLAYRCLFAILLSGGLRISEALMLQRCDFELSPDGMIYFHSRVLKKGSRKVERKNVVHPDAKITCAEHLLSLRGFDKLFSFSRKAALHMIKKYLGDPVDLHALRHSYFSYLIFQKELNIEEASRFVEVSSSTILKYAHIDQDQILKTVFDDGILKVK